MSNKQQTVVKWLQEALEGTILTQDQTMQTIGLFMQADEMFEQQIKDACQQGFYDGIDIAKNKKSQFISAQEYYNETFNQ